MNMPTNHQVGGKGDITNQQRPSSSALYRPPASSAPHTITGHGQLNAGFMSDIGVGQLNAGFVSDIGTGEVKAPYQPNRRHSELPQVHRWQGGRDDRAESGADSRRGQQHVPERVPTGIPNFNQNGALYPKLEAPGGNNKYNENHSQPDTQGLSRKTRLPSFAARYMRQKNKPRDTSQGNDKSKEHTESHSQPENQDLSRKTRLPSFASRYKRQKNEPREEIRQGNDQPDEYTEIPNQPENQGLSRKARLPSFAVRYMHRKKEPRERPYGNDESDITRDEATIQIVRSPSPDLPKSEPLCEFDVPRRIVYMVTAGVLIFLLLLLIILSATLTRSSTPPPTTPKTLSTTEAWTTGRVSTVTTRLTSSTLPTTTTTNTVTTVPLPTVTATYLMDCTIQTDLQPIIDNMCWLSDTNLVIADSALRVLIVNVDVNGRRCTIQNTFTITNRSQEMKCSDHGEFFIKTVANNFFLVYNENGDPNGEWRPTDLHTSLNTIAINKERMVTADYYEIALYTQNRQFLSKRRRVVKLTNVVESYLSRDDMFWSCPKGDTLKVYDLNSESVNSVNIKSEHMSGTGDYVFVNDGTKRMQVYTQGGMYVQGLNIGGNITTPDDMAIRKRLPRSDSIMAIEDYSVPYGRYKIYQISMDFTAYISR